MVGAIRDVGFRPIVLLMTRNPAEVIYSFTQERLALLTHACLQLGAQVTELRRSRTPIYKVDYARGAQPHRRHLQVPRDIAVAMAQTFRPTRAQSHAVDKLRARQEPDVEVLRFMLRGDLQQRRDADRRWRRGPIWILKQLECMLAAQTATNPFIRKPEKTATNLFIRRPPSLAGPPGNLTSSKQKPK